MAAGSLGHGVEDVGLVVRLLTPVLVVARQRDVIAFDLFGERVGSRAHGLFLLLVAVTVLRDGVGGEKAEGDLSNQSEQGSNLLLQAQLDVRVVDRVDRLDVTQWSTAGTCLT